MRIVGEAQAEMQQSGVATVQTVRAFRTRLISFTNTAELSDVTEGQQFMTSKENNSVHLITIKTNKESRIHRQKNRRTSVFSG